MSLEEMLKRLKMKGILQERLDIEKGIKGIKGMNNEQLEELKNMIKSRKKVDK